MVRTWPMLHSDDISFETFNGTTEDNATVDLPHAQLHFHVGCLFSTFFAVLRFKQLIKRIRYEKKNKYLSFIDCKTNVKQFCTYLQSF